MNCYTDNVDYRNNFQAYCMLCLRKFDFNRIYRSKRGECRWMNPTWTRAKARITWRDLQPRSVGHDHSWPMIYEHLAAIAIYIIIEINNMPHTFTNELQYHLENLNGSWRTQPFSLFPIFQIADNNKYSSEHATHLHFQQEHNALPVRLNTDHNLGYETLSHYLFQPRLKIAEPWKRFVFLSTKWHVIDVAYDLNKWSKHKRNRT